MSKAWVKRKEKWVKGFWDTTVFTSAFFFSGLAILKKYEDISEIDSAADYQSATGLELILKDEICLWDNAYIELHWRRGKLE